MSFWEFFGYYVTARLLLTVGVVCLVLAIPVAAYFAGGLGLLGAKLMGRVWGDRDLDGKRDE